MEYWDTDGDGVLDRIVTVFDRKLTEADIDGSLYLSFPWYSYRGMLIQLQAQPEALKIDPDDSTRVIWEVFSPTELAKGVTSISEKLPEANVYTYYHIWRNLRKRRIGSAGRQDASGGCFGYAQLWQKG